MREAAVQALGGLADPHPREPLLVAVRDHGWRVREAAVQALGYLADPIALEALLEAFRDERWVCDSQQCQLSGD